MTLLFTIPLIILGASFGSFFYTLSLRLVDERYKGHALRLLILPSNCPECHAPVGILRLIPVIGYCIARGKCRSCNTRISPAYPLAEIAGGVLFYSVFFVMGVSIRSGFDALFIATVCAAGVSDIKTMRVPNTLVLLALLFALYPVIITGDYRSNLYGALLLGGFFFLIILFFPGGFGGGDFKLATVIGLFLGIENAVVSLEIALITGTIFGVTYAIISKRGLRIQIPFAPYLAFGLVIAYFWGEQIALLYYSLS